MITFEQAQQAQELQIVGVCPGDPDFVKFLNRGTRLLMKRGNWTSTIQFVTACAYGDKVVWNRYVGTPLAIDLDLMGTIPQNLWYDWLLPGDVEARNRYMYWQHWRCGSVHTVAEGTLPVFREIPKDTPSYIQVFLTNPQDVGKTITFFYLDANNQPIYTRRSDGTYQPGEQLTLALPWVSSQQPCLRVDRVVKDFTQGRLNVFQFNAATGTQEPLAVYEGDETNPSYQVTRIARPNPCCGNRTVVTAMVKIKYVPVRLPMDLVQIENLDALALAMQSAKCSDAYDHQGAETALTRAVWTPNLSTDIFAGFAHVSYDSTATGYFRTAFGCPTAAPTGAMAQTAVSTVGLVNSCNPNWSYLEVGSKTTWRPLPDLSISGQIMYNRVYSALSGQTNLNTAGGAPVVGARAAGVYNTTDEGIWTAYFRIQRNYAAAGAE